MTRTRRNRSNRNRKPKSCKNMNLKFEQNIVTKFLEVLNTVKLYHWKTHSYAVHKATDELYSKMQENVDRFVEVLLGKDEKRINMLEKRIDLLDMNSKEAFKNRMFSYRKFLTDMNIYFDDTRDSDLLNIRDELLADLNQFLYLFSFSKI
jgi:DNA-binding ferritin-like protein